MIKDVKYTGYTAVPSDYEVPDGDLAFSLNLINETGSITPIKQPEVVGQLTGDSGERIIFIHNVTGKKNYIVIRIDENGGYLVFWVDSTLFADTTESATELAQLSNVLDVTSVGNTLIFATDDGLKYYLWKDDNYIDMGTCAPNISIDFGMDLMGTLIDKQENSIPGTCAFGYFGGVRGEASKEELSELTQMVYSLINSSVADNITSKGYFYQPFFIRYAYRLYDGTYCWHSAPILMLPTTIPPIVKYTDNLDGRRPSSSETVNATFQLNINYFALSYRILSDGIEGIENWADIISGIDIFVSTPIYTYDQSKDLEIKPIRNLKEMLLSIYDWGKTDPRLDSYQEPSSVVVGHYCVGYGGKHKDYTMSTALNDGYPVVNIKQHDFFHDNIRNAHEFYKIAEIDIKNIKAMDTMSVLKLNLKDMSSLVTRERLSDDYQSHCKIVPSSLYTYNSRLNLSGVSITPADPFPLRACTQFSNPTDSLTTIAKITVWTRMNGIRTYGMHIGKSGNDSDTFYDLINNFPRYIYYPDASAYKMEIMINENERYIINLTSHNFLNGAYYYSANFGVSHKPDNQKPETAQCTPSIYIGTKIYTSEVNNPFYFPVTGINTIGTGNILGMATAAKALSEGQFGQFPLYAFTDEGVWAMEVSATGTYSAKQPITRDVCINPEGITQIDSAVLFPTDRGIMLISGSNVTCISEPINSETPFDILSLPQMNRLHAMLGHDADTCLPLLPFSEFLKECRMIYDYNHQRIIVYNKNVTYAYVYSLKTQLWGMMQSNFNHNINSYPEALAVTTEGTLVNFARTSEEPTPGLLVTRPLKLDGQDILKTIDTIIQRGNFSKGHVRSVLYGSRDLINWSLVWSSKDHFMRGFRGTPYKYFRIALLCNLDDGESIAGATVSHSPRHTNRLR